MFCQALHRFGQKLVRRRTVEQPVAETARSLTTLDLVALGVNYTVDVSLFILIGQVARDTAGPSIVISFLVAGLTSVLAGLSYAEISSRVLCSGSSYLYSFVTIGELGAFITGWNLISINVVFVSIVIRVWILIFESIFGNQIFQTLYDSISQNISRVFAEILGFLVVFLVLFFIEFLTRNIRKIPLVTKVFASVKILVLSFVIIAGFIKGDLHNWRLTEEDYIKAGLNDTTNLGPLGSGGFVPFGFEGILHGAATCIYLFGGFTIIITRVGEAKNPQRSILRSIVITLFICFFLHFGVFAAFTLMVPYYQLHRRSTLPEAFLHIGWDPAYYVVALVILCAVIEDSFDFIDPLKWVIHTMAQDGLLFPVFAWIHTGTYTPIVATVIFGIIAAIIAVFFGVTDILDFISVEVLIVFSLLVFGVLIVRYQPEMRNEGNEAVMQDENGPPEEKLTLQRLLFPSSTTPTPFSGRVVYICSSLLVLLLILFCLVLTQWPALLSGYPEWISVVVILLVLITGITGVIWRQPQNSSPLPFKVTALPLLPLLSIFINVYLMMQITAAAWALFGVWMLIGFAIYFSYGIQHSLVVNLT